MKELNWRRIKHGIIAVKRLEGKDVIFHFQGYAKPPTQEEGEKLRDLIVLTQEFGVTKDDFKLLLAPPEVVQEYIKQRAAGAHRLDKTPVGKVTVLAFIFQDQILKEWINPYYLSKSGRYCFRGHYARHNGMKESNFGVFHLDGDMAFMVTKPDRHHKDKAHFLGCVLRHNRRQAKERGLL